jgi:hypothetical protein
MRLNHTARHIRALAMKGVWLSAGRAGASAQPLVAVASARTVTVTEQMTELAIS